MFLDNIIIPVESFPIGIKFSEGYDEAQNLKKAKNVLSKTIQINYSIAANGDFNYNLKAKIDSEMPLGYKFLAIIGFGIGNVYVYPINIAYRNDEYGFQIGNRSNQPWTEKATIYYLIVPS